MPENLKKGAFDLCGEYSYSIDREMALRNAALGDALMAEAVAEADFTTKTADLAAATTAEAAKGTNAAETRAKTAATRAVTTAQAAVTNFFRVWNLSAGDLIALTGVNTNTAGKYTLQIVTGSNVAKLYPVTGATASAYAWDNTATGVTLSRSYGVLSHAEQAMAPYDEVSGDLTALMVTLATKKELEAAAIQALADKNAAILALETAKAAAEEAEEASEEARDDAVDARKAALKARNELRRDMSIFARTMELSLPSFSATKVWTITQARLRTITDNTSLRGNQHFSLDFNSDFEEVELVLMTASGSGSNVTYSVASSNTRISFNDGGISDLDMAIAVMEEELTWPMADDS